jgi:hypothetical protein
LVDEVGELGDAPVGEIGGAEIPPTALIAIAGGG